MSHAHRLRCRDVSHLHTFGGTTNSTTFFWLAKMHRNMQLCLLGMRFQSVSLRCLVISRSDTPKLHRKSFWAHPPKKNTTIPSTFNPHSLGRCSTKKDQKTPRWDLHLLKSPAEKNAKIYVTCFSCCSNIRFWRPFGRIWNFGATSQHDFDIAGPESKPPNPGFQYLDPAIGTIG